MGDLECGTSYEFRVSAYGDGTTYAAAWGAESAAQTASTSACPLEAPAAPENLTAGTVTEASVPLSWDAVTGASKYRVEYREGNPDGWTVDDETITGTSHTVDGLECGTSYEFRVTAYGDGTTYAAAWGAASAVQTASTSDCPPAPPAPQNLAAGTVTERSVPLSWNAVTGATKYRVEYREGEPDGWTLSDEAIAGTSHTVDDLECGTSYEFRVTAYGDGTTYAAAWGAESTAQTASTSACPPDPPPAPQNLTAVVNSDSSITLSWEAPDDRHDHWLPDLAAAAERRRGRVDGVRRGHRKHGDQLHGLGHDGGHPARLPGEGHQRRRPEQVVQLRQPDAVGAGMASDLRPGACRPRVSLPQGHDVPPRMRAMRIPRWVSGAVRAV